MSAFYDIEFGLLEEEFDAMLTVGGKPTPHRTRPPPSPRDVVARPRAIFLPTLFCVLLYIAGAACAFLQ